MSSESPLHERSAIGGAEPTPPVPHPHGALAGNLRTLLPYLIAGAVFVAIGVMDPRFMLNWTPGTLLLVLVAWVIPNLWRRWRG